MIMVLLKFEYLFLFELINFILGLGFVSWFKYFYMIDIYEFLCI